MELLKKSILSLFVLVFLFSAIGVQVLATPTKNLEKEKAGEVGYSVQKMSRDNTESAYFDLNIKPEDKKVLKARIFNDTDKPMKIKMSIFTASTSNKVQIVYTKKSPKNDDTLQYYMEDLVKIKDGNEVTVPANAQVDVEANVTIPKEISGVYLGSWYFEKIKEDEESKNEGVNINNQYSYAMAIKLEASQISNPNINLLKVEPGLDNYHRAIIAKVQNDRPSMMTGVTIKTTVKEKNKKEILYKSEEKNLKIAPNTTFDYSTFLDGELLRAGKYVFEMNVKTTESKLTKKEWDFKKEFTVSDKEVTKLNKDAINEENSQTSMWIIVGLIALFAIIIGVVIWMFLKKRKVTKKK